jgi:hypothetical protein
MGSGGQAPAVTYNRLLAQLNRASGRESRSEGEPCSARARVKVASNSRTSG